MPKALFLPFGRFVAVGTPHVLEQSIKRAKTDLVDFMATHKVNLLTVYDTMQPDTCHWLEIENFLLYMRKKYNTVRHRNELELISLTPDTFKNTKNNASAKPLAPSSVNETSFPSWFGDDEE